MNNHRRTPAYDAGPQRTIDQQPRTNKGPRLSQRAHDRTDLPVVLSNANVQCCTKAPSIQPTTPLNSYKKSRKAADVSRTTSEPQAIKAQNQPAAKLASTRDTHAQTRRRIDTQTKPAHGTNSLRQSSHATPDQTKQEAPPQIRQCDRKRAHATPHQWVTTARPRDAKERSLGNDAQWVTVPIYRSCAIRYSSPIQVAHGSCHSVRGD